VGWRSVVINQPAKLKREHFALVIEQSSGNKASVPFEDIAVIVLHNREITLTHPVLAACGEYGISLFATGDNHQPNGVFLPYLQHTRTVKMLRLQRGLDKPASKRAWAMLIRAKINNQGACIRLAGRSGDVEETLASFARRLRSGDPDNLEAQASAIYFPALYGHGFTRANESWSNAALNYGYAIFRGAIARALVAHGLHPSEGIFHASEQNAFNLADDVIEPFRPIVDLHVARKAMNPINDGELTPDDKAGLIALLNVDVGMPRGAMAALAAIEHTVESLMRLYDGHSEVVLELPQLIGLRAHALDA
jgi:CRISP-associated protein Cas1